MSAASSLNGSGLKDLDFLGLGSETAQYEYQGVDHFLAVLDHDNDLFATDRTGEKSQYLVFYNLSEQQFNQDFNISTSDTALTYESYSKPAAPPCQNERIRAALCGCEIVRKTAVIPARHHGSSRSRNYTNRHGAFSGA